MAENLKKYLNAMQELPENNLPSQGDKKTRWVRL